MRKHDQTKRHVISVPMPFTTEQLTMLIKHCNGWEDDDEIVKNYVDQIIEEGKVNLNPSSSLGDGANIVDIFSYGFMAYMKDHFNVDVDPNMLWFHPCAQQRPAMVKTIEIEYEDVEVESNENVMYMAIDGETGKPISAEEAAKKCSGNSDDLEAYKE